MKGLLAVAVAVAVLVLGLPDLADARSDFVRSSPPESLIASWLTNHDGAQTSPNFGEIKKKNPFDFYLNPFLENNNKIDIFNFNY